MGTIDLDLKKDKFESYLLNYIPNCMPRCYRQLYNFMPFLLVNHGSRSLRSHVRRLFRQKAIFVKNMRSKKNKKKQSVLGEQQSKKIRRGEGKKFKAGWFPVDFEVDRRSSHRYRMVLDVQRRHIHMLSEGHIGAVSLRVF